MLDTLYQFGRQLSQNADREEFDDLILVPPIDPKDLAKGIQFHVARMVFDLDNGTFWADKRTKEFSALDKSYEHSPYALRCIKIQSGNNKSVYPTVDPRKSYEPWKKTFFGKEDKNGGAPKQSELVEAIQKDYPDLADRLFCTVTARIFSMREAFEADFPDLKTLSSAFDIDDRNKIAMLSAAVICSELGIEEPTPITKLDGFDDFLRRKMTKGGSTEANDKDVVLLPKRCYVTGDLKSDVGEPEFSTRYNLNKMFVTTTKNYASGFDDGNFIKNYQASAEAQVFLERGSEHILKHYTVKIAGIDHCIIPQFLSGQDIDFDAMTTRLKNHSELLFLMHRKQVGSAGLFDDFKKASDWGMYWVNFIGFESDGKFFKSINRIEDISKTYFEQVLKVLDSVNDEMEQIEGVQWDRVMTYGKEQQLYDFNFNTIYNLIPVRKEKEKRNEALVLFKSILERRPILPDKIFEHFTTLIQCHRFDRYAGSNLVPNSNFDFATRDAVFQYHAFILLLKKLKLLNMEEPMATTATLEEKNAAITTFFERMGYNDDHRAVFYLGRVLNQVGYAQAQKGHDSKPILNKINYNGMDATALKRLHADLFEKCKQYDILVFNEVNFSKFTDLFKDSKFEQWDKRMKPDETLFYLLAGYSFRMPKESDTDTKSDN